MWPLLVLTGCAVRLGGPTPEEYRVVALRPGAAAAADEIAQELGALGADLALMSAARDSTWFAETAAAAGRQLSGPGRSRAVALAFLAGEAVGDTTLLLPLEGGGELLVQDALYEVDDTRFLDLMAVALEPGTDPRAAMRALLAYVATDVMSGAAVILALFAPDAATADSAATLLKPALSGTTLCDEGTEEDGSVRLLFGPALQVRCREARPVDSGLHGVFARLVVSR